MSYNIFIFSFIQNNAVGCVYLQLNQIRSEKRKANRPKLSEFIVCLFLLFPKIH